MIVLGFDTATPASTVALRLADGRTAERRHDPPRGEHPGHATHLLDMADGLLTEAGLGWAEIDRLAVGVGPGTFTGLRVGIATVRGLGQSLSTPIVGVSSLAALAQGALTPLDGDGRGPEGGGRADDGDRILAVIDARRGEAFVAAYERGEGPGPTELSAPRALAPEDLAGVIYELDEGGGDRRWLAVGDGAIRFSEILEGEGIPPPPEDSPLHRIGGGAICELAARAAAAGRPEEIVPDYRRRPDAELAFQDAGRGD